MSCFASDDETSITERPIGVSGHSRNLQMNLNEQHSLGNRDFCDQFLYSWLFPEKLGPRGRKSHRHEADKTRFLLGKIMNSGLFGHTRKQNFDDRERRTLVTSFQPYKGSATHKRRVFYGLATVFSIKSIPCDVPRLATSGLFSLALSPICPKFVYRFLVFLAARPCSVHSD
jgi:hypothetical protein